MYGVQSRDSRTVKILNLNNSNFNSELHYQIVQKGQIVYWNCTRMVSHNALAKRRGVAKRWEDIELTF